MSVKREARRPRGNSVSNALHNIELRIVSVLRVASLVAGLFEAMAIPAISFLGDTPKSGSPVPRAKPKPSLLSNVITGRWMTDPTTSFAMIVSILVLWTNWHFLAPAVPNPFEPLIFVSYLIKDSPPDAPKYAKGPLDILFVLFYVIVWSFVRQFLTLHVLRPLGMRLGIRKSAKLDRFGEQGYAVIYFSFFGSLGVFVMSQLPTWWFRTEYFWIDYPHWQMTPLIKRYYLMQLAYWVQQLIVLALKLEKPRKDWTELVIHHIVTIWLVGWSYAVNLTLIGNAIFLTMDVSDIFLAFAKCLNYLKLEKTSTVAFAFFMVVWSYLRHYLNIMILYSVWTDWDLIPVHARRWSPEDGVWLAGWMKYQVFIPILLLQFVNLFWYFLILRILYRVLTTSVIADERSDDEDDEDPKKK